MTNFEKVKQFHEVFGHLINKRPTIDVDRTLLNLRRDLITEEYRETLEVFRDIEAFLQNPELFENPNSNEIILENLAKELADILYVVYGCALVYGIDLDKAFATVHESNMSKLDPETGKPIFREDGKVLKGPNYAPPDMSVVIRESNLGD